jgi:hypothetical protein
VILYDEASQEEEDRDVKEGREGLDGDMNIETVETLCKEGADVGTLMDRDVRLRQSEASASPALLERCE